jgi:hypothetical protein
MSSSAVFSVKMFSSMSWALVRLRVWLMSVASPTIIGVLVVAAKMFILLSPYWLAMVIFWLLLTVSEVLVSRLSKGAPVIMMKFISVISAFFIVHLPVVGTRAKPWLWLSPAVAKVLLLLLSVLVWHMSMVVPMSAVTSIVFVLMSHRSDVCGKFVALMYELQKSMFM